MSDQDTKLDNALNRLVLEQKEPVANDLPAVWDLVIADMKARDQEGRRKYKVPLQPFNGRNAAVDGYQEVLDLVVYQRQLLVEIEALGDDVRFLLHEVEHAGDYKTSLSRAVSGLYEILAKYHFLDKHE